MTADLLTAAAALLARVADLEKRIAELESRLPDERLTAAQVADYYHVPLQTVYNRMGKGRIPTHKGETGPRYCLRSELDAFEAWASARRTQGKAVSVEGWRAEKGVKKLDISAIK